MTTPKEALRPFAACVFNDNGDITIDTSHLRTEDYMRAKSALASFEGEAVERTIKAALIAADCDSGDGSYIHCSVEKVVRAILATGLVPDEAAIRADEREKCAKVAVARSDAVMAEAEAAHDDDNYDLYERLECEAGNYMDLAAAIRSGGGE